MSEAANPLAELILARPVMPSKKPPAPAAVHKGVAPLIRGGVSKERLAEVLAELRSAGLLPARDRHDRFRPHPPLSCARPGRTSAEMQLGEGEGRLPHS